MNIVLLISAVLLVIAGVVFNQIKSDRIIQPPVSQEQEESQETQEESEVEIETPTPTQKPIAPKPTAPQIQQTPRDEGLLSSLSYPNAEVVSSGESTLTLRSNDDSDVITDWYKEKITGLGMNTKSFVKTKTNDNVLNKLVGADGQTEIRVEITKQANNPTTEIKVTAISS